MRAPAIALTAVLAGGAILTACATSSSSSRTDGDRAPVPDDDRSELAYGVGFYLGEEVREGLNLDGVEIDLELVVRGFREGLKDLAPVVDRAHLDDVLEAVHVEMQRRMVTRRLEEDPRFRRLHDGNLERSKAFHAEFGATPEVVTLASGAQYQILERGDGPIPSTRDAVLVTYRCERIDGQIVDIAERRRLVVGETLPGPRELLQRMPVGSRWKFAVPPHLAFGAAGDPPLIGPNESLTAEVELVAIVGPEAEG